MIKRSCPQLPLPAKSDAMIAADASRTALGEEIYTAGYVRGSGM